MRLVPFCAAVLVLSKAGPAIAQPGDATESCIESHAESQKRRKNGELRAAQKLLFYCAREACPGPIRAECSQWAQEVDASIPTILIEVPAADGSLIADVEIRIDGELREKTISGLPVGVDPGERAIEVRPKGEVPRRRKVLVVLDDKRRRIRLEPATQAALPPKPETEPAGFSVQTPDVPAIVVGSFGLAALAVGMGFGIRATVHAEELESCSPHCAREDGEAMRREALVADICFGAGIGLLGIATVVWLTQPSEPVASALSGRFTF